MAGLLEKTRIVLVRPAIPENVGSVARAMHNLGLGRLTIVGAPGLKDQPPARRLAVESGHILESAREVGTFDEAVAGAGLILGTTAHTSYETWHLLEPAEAIALARTAAGEVAIVFGSERHGLPRDLLRRCDQVLHLPTAQPECSLNLAQAVLLVAWEWWKAAQAGNASDMGEAEHAAPFPDLGPEWPHLLEEAGALKPHNREKRLATLRRILSRIRLSEEEAALVRGIGSKLALYLRLRGRRVE